MESLMNMPSATNEQIAHLCQLINTVDDSINTFTALSRPQEHWDDLFVYYVESKLAESTRRDWVKEMTTLKVKDGFAKYTDIKNFIEERIRNLDVVEARANAVAPSDDGSCHKNAWLTDAAADGGRRHFKQKLNKSARAHVATRQAAQPTAKSTCSFCKGEHFVGFCTKFSSCSQVQRRAHVVSAKLCYNCLNSNHTVDACHSKGRCLVCGSRHHTKLHQNAKVVFNASATVVEDTDATSSESCNAHVRLSKNAEHFQGMLVPSYGSALLATACVLLEAPSGQTMTVRALLDSGAEESFLTEHVVQTLSLRKHSANVVVSGVGGSTTATAKSRVSVRLKSRQNTEFCFNRSALVLRKLSSVIPYTELPKQAWPHLMDLQLTDPHFNVPSRIDCILNSEVYAAVVLPGIKRGSPGSPVALRTVFGWVLMGAIHSEDSSCSREAHHVTVHHELSKAVEHFWETEEILTRPILSTSEQECYDHFHKTHARDQQGRFIVRLPFIKPPTPFNSRGIAEAYLSRLERRFSRQTDLFEAYRSFMREYLELGHMEVMSDAEVRASDTYYLPHHPVLKNNDCSKIRVVFNASQKNKEETSLNSLFHTGPKLQEDVLIVIARWSFFSVVFTCDVKKIFRQFLVNKEDADWQRIVWRQTPEFPISTYRLLTVTYGTVPAPFLPNACMLQLAKDEKERYPEGAKMLVDGRYVDDLFAGGDSVKEAMNVREQLIGILMSAGMRVGKRAANRSELLADLESKEENDKGAMFKDQEVVPTLGLRWLSAEDALCFKITEFKWNEQITKRSILSEIANFMIQVDGCHQLSFLQRFCYKIYGCRVSNGMTQYQKN